MSLANILFDWLAIVMCSGVFFKHVYGRMRRKRRGDVKYHLGASKKHRSASRQLQENTTVRTPRSSATKRS